MATSAAPLPFAGSGTAPVQKKEPEIVVIPEEFYGVALKLKVAVLKEQLEAPAAPVAPKPIVPATPVIQPPAKAFPWALIASGLGFFLVVGGVFVYLNRDLLFKKPVQQVPAVVEAPPLPAPPTAPANLIATSTAGAVALSWVDTSGEEDGYRVERREAISAGAFLPLTNLGANSTAFLDPSVLPATNYTYRVVATNAGGESAPSNEVDVTMPALPVVEPPRPSLPPGGLDSDSDGLSDVEELVYGTDARNPETDGDSHLDGNEVFHLYNPAARAPGRLLDSGLVRLVTSPIGWSIYVPRAWTERPDPTNPSKTTVDTTHGETFSLFLEQNTAGKTLRDWYAEMRPSATGTLRDVTTKGGLQGLVGADQLEVFFAWQDKVFVIRYELNGQNFINFRTTYEMMLNSLQLSGAPVVPTTLSPATDGPGALLEGSASSTPSNPPVSSPSTASSTVSEPIAATSTTTVPTSASTTSSAEGVSASAPPIDLSTSSSSASVTSSATP